MTQRSAKECEIRWLGDRHPRFNHSSWDESEIVAARKLVEGREAGDVDWVSIAEQLGVRTSLLHPPTMLTEVKDAAYPHRCYAKRRCAQDARMGRRIR